MGKRLTGSSTSRIISSETSIREVKYSHTSGSPRNICNSDPEARKIKPQAGISDGRRFYIFEKLGHRHSQLCLLQHGHHLLHRKALLLHAKSPFRFCRRLTFALAQKYRGPSWRPIRPFRATIGKSISSVNALSLGPNTRAAVSSARDERSSCGPEIINSDLHFSPRRKV